MCLKKNEEVYNKVKKFSRDKYTKIDSDKFSMEIDTAMVQTITNDAYVSYTFAIKAGVHSDVTYNYVLTQYTNNEFHQMLITYPKYIDNGKITYDFDNATVENIEGDIVLFGSTCNGTIYTEWNITCTDHPCTAGGKHLPGQLCDGEPYEQPYTSCEGAWVDTCVENESLDPGPGYTGGGGITGGNEDGGGTESNIPVVPLEPTKTFKYYEFTTVILSAVEKDFFENDLKTHNTESYNAIITYLENKHWYANAMSFAQQAIAALMSEEPQSYNESNYPGIDYGYPYNWWNNDEYIENNFSFELDDQNFGNLTAQEKLLVIAFPIKAIMIKNNKQPAEVETVNRFGINGKNDKSDAFRHAFFNAMNANDVGLVIANLFSDAHESENPPHLIKEEQMDLFNNDIGLSIGAGASIFVSDQELSNTVYQSLLNGLLVYLSPLAPVIPPNFGITSATQLTPTNN